MRGGDNAQKETCEVNGHDRAARRRRPGVTRSRNQEQEPGAGTRSRNQEQEPGAGTRSRNQEQEPGAGTRSRSQEQEPGAGTRSRNQEQEPGAGTRSRNQEQEPGAGTRSRSQEQESGAGTRSRNQEQEPVKSWQSGDSLKLSAPHLSRCSRPPLWRRSTMQQAALSCSPPLCNAARLRPRRPVNITDPPWSNRRPLVEFRAETCHSCDQLPGSDPWAAIG